MNTQLTQEERNEILGWLKRREEYAKENTSERTNINLSTNIRDVVISTNKEVLKPEGRVELQLDMWLQGNINNFINEQEFIVSFPMTYLDDNGICGITHYYKCYGSKEINKVKLVNEIIDQAKILLNKEYLTIKDFDGVRGYGDIIHGIDENGNKYWDLTNIEIYKPQRVTVYTYSDKENKKTTDKEFFELTIDDTDKIINELKIDINTSQGEAKQDIVRMFCKNNIALECFMYRGYNFSTLDAYVYIDKDKLDIQDRIDILDIKPKYIEYPPESYIIKFAPNKRFYFERWIDYMMLLISFIEYIESINIEGVIIKFDFSPFENNEFVQVNNDLEVRQNVKFTKELFSYSGIIKD